LLVFFNNKRTGQTTVVKPTNEYSTMNLYAKEYAEFTTATCLEWKPIIHQDRFKDIIMESLRFLCTENRVWLNAFVIMHNHIHLVWQMIGEHRRNDVQRDFLKYTGQQILKHLRNEHSPLLTELKVNAKDRTYQVWERNTLSIALWSTNVFWQKIEYIHNNPVRAGYCKYPEEYKYSSAEFYLTGKSEWNFLTHFED